MTLSLYNSLTRNKEPFKPITPGKIGIYVCGITVYDQCHVGHARSMVCFDVMVRFLRQVGYEVKYVRNITDIDDKIIARAHEQGISIQTLTDRYIQAMHADERALFISPPDVEPRATEYLSEMIHLIERLVQSGHAYVSDTGDVCYQVSQFKDYGKLSQKDIDGLMAGARVDIVKEKRSPLDFVLWKKAKPGEPFWPSPWGDGRPGWHIECSAMSMNQLGEQFDIHGGGLDLQFPHHENEIAQSEGATGQTFANYWLHVGLLQVNHEKMSKSTGNFYTIVDVLKEYHPEVIRYFLLSNHYRSPLNYSKANLLNAGKALMRLYQSMKEVDTSQDKFDETWMKQFNEAMFDDINTPIALSLLFQLSHEVNKTKSPVLAATLKHLGGILGLLQEVPEIFLQAGMMVLQDDHQEIETLIAEREQARLARHWARADEIRAMLTDKGIELEDTQAGTTWRRMV